MVKFFKAEAEGDVIYFHATSIEDAEDQLAEKIGQIPDSLVTWTELDSLPDGAEYI